MGSWRTRLGGTHIGLRDGIWLDRLGSHLPMPQESPDDIAGGNLWTARDRKYCRRIPSPIAAVDLLGHYRSISETELLDYHCANFVVEAVAQENPTLKAQELVPPHNKQLQRTG